MPERQERRPANARHRRGRGFVAVLFCLAALVCVMAAPASAFAAAKWTVMVYGDGDNNLESYLASDIDDEFCGPGSGSDANVKVLFLGDRIPGYDTSDGDWTSTKLFYCTEGMTATPANALADWGERNMGDPQTLVDLVGYCKTNYPADRYLLIFWDHGYTWWPEYCMWDDTSADGLTLPEMTSAMDTVGGVDVVAWDCCSCSAAEMAQTWRPYAQYLVGSEDLTMAEGVAWETVVPALRTTPTMSAATLATTIGANMNDGTSSALALDSRWDTLRSAVDQWGVALRNGLPANKTAYDNAKKVTRTFAADSTLVDLYDAAAQIKLAVTDVTIQNACQAVMDAVTACVVYESHKPKFAGARGITIFWPKTTADLTATDWGSYNGWDLYRSLPWTAQTSWESFIGPYVYADYTAPTTTSSADGSWHASPYTVTLSATDNSGGSGVFDTQYRVGGGAWQTGASATVRALRKYRGGDGRVRLSYRSSDVAANYETTQTVTLKIDGYKPTTTDDSDGLPHASPVTVHLTARDRHSGVAATYYRIDGGSWQSGTSVLIAAPADHSNDGTHTIEYYSVDNVGNTAPVRSCTVVIAT